MKCCENFCIEKLADIGQHHHKNCPNYGTQKHPYLFYHCDGQDAWIPASEMLENTIDVANLEDKEEYEVRFKRLDLTDKEYDEMPED